jgi:hypothetical protein
MLDLVTSAVVVLLGCSPAMLVCQPMPQVRWAIYSTVAECENALRGQLARTKTADQILIGRCQTIGELSDVIDWGTSPTRKLPTSVAPGKLVSPVPVDAISTGSIRSAEGAASDYTTVLVTRGARTNGITTSYIVKRSN